MLFELVIAVAGTLVIGWLARGAIGRRRSKAQDWMHAELRMARLAYAERLCRSTGSVAVFLPRWIGPKAIRPAS